jgi:hypothetical protein
VEVSRRRRIAAGALAVALCALAAFAGRVQGVAHKPGKDGKQEVIALEV